MLCDIGNGTMNVMYINEFRPVLGGCYTEKFGTHQCMLAVRENVLRLNLEKEADRGCPAESGRHWLRAARRGTGACTPLEPPGQQGRSLTKPGRDLPLPRTRAASAM